MSWYEGKSCALCGKTLRTARWLTKWFANPPALMSPEGRTLETGELRSEEIDELLQTHRPVCWDCHLRKAFQRARGGSEPSR